MHKPAAPAPRGPSVGEARAEPVSPDPLMRARPPAPALAGGDGKGLSPRRSRGNMAPPVRLAKPWRPAVPPPPPLAVGGRKAFARKGLPLSGPTGGNEPDESDADWQLPLPVPGTLPWFNPALPTEHHPVSPLDQADFARRWGVKQAGAAPVGAEAAEQRRTRSALSGPAMTTQRATHPAAPPRRAPALRRVIARALLVAALLALAWKEPSEATRPELRLWGWSARPSAR